VQTRKDKERSQILNAKWLGAATGSALVAGLVGVLLGVGGFTGYYGEGLSYFSSNPAACTNCHIMKPQFDSWQKASHHTIAGCVDCHLPQGFL
jgi:cytochrome c nitrite reductase small subunit